MMPDKDVSEPYVETNRIDPSALPGSARAEDEPDLDGYDETQRAEIAEVEGGGPNDGIVMTDMDPDFGGDIDEDEIEDDADKMDAIMEADGDFA